MKQLHDINEKVLNGELNALEAYVELKRTEKLLKDVLKGVKEQAVEEAEKYGEKTFDAFGATIEMRAGGGTWNYKDLPWWDSFKAKQEAAQKAYKSSQVYMTIVDDNGEIIKPAIYKPNSPTISVKL